MNALYKKLDKNLLLCLLISIFVAIFLAYMLNNILDIFNPILVDEDCSVLTPQLQDLLAELEEKFK